MQELCQFAREAAKKFFFLSDRVTKKRPFLAASLTKVNGEERVVFGL